MYVSEDLKTFAQYLCPIITMIGVILTLVVTIHINREILMESLYGYRPTGCLASPGRYDQNGQ